MDRATDMGMGVKMVFHIIMRDMENKELKTLDNMIIPMVTIRIAKEKAITMETTIQIIMDMETI